jgi:hypothetical protein
MNTKYNLLTLGVILFFSLFLFSCKKDSTTDPVPEDPASPYLKISQAVSVGSSFDLTMYAKDSLYVGYNVVYFKLTDKSTGQAMSSANLSMLPIMDMISFKHSCPFENPNGSLNADGYFSGAILFSMAGTNNSWSNTVTINANGITDTCHLFFKNVVATTPARKIVVLDSVEYPVGVWTITKYPISLIIPEKWNVGNNPFEITIHKMASMMSFPAVTDLTVEIDPEMVSMGHGSPNNVNPVHTANGHYVGSVNYTMTGDWRIFLTIKQGSRQITNSAYFDITF